VRRHHLLDWHSISSLPVRKWYRRECKSFPITSSCSERQRINSGRTSAEWERVRQWHGSNKHTYRCGCCSKRWMGNAWGCYRRGDRIALSSLCSLQNTLKCTITLNPDSAIQTNSIPFVCKKTRSRTMTRLVLMYSQWRLRA